MWARAAKQRLLRPMPLCRPYCSCMCAGAPNSRLQGSHTGQFMVTRGAHFGAVCVAPEWTRQESPSGDNPLAILKRDPYNHPLPGLYRHYKSGDVYRVLGTVLHTETSEAMVLYYTVNPNERTRERNPFDMAFVRPREMFLETVEHKRALVPRFQRLAVETENVSDVAERMTPYPSGDRMKPPVVGKSQPIRAEDDTASKT